MPKQAASVRSQTVLRIKTLPPFGLMVISIAYVIEITTFPLILGGLSEEFDLSQSTAQSLVSSYKFALVASILVAGWIGDRVSREGVFAVGAFLFSAASFAFIFATDTTSLMQLRIAQGVGAGLFSPMIPALLAARRPTGTLAALSYWGMLTGAAAAVYPYIAAQLTLSFSWQAGWSVVPLAALIALLGLPCKSDRAAVPEPAPTKKPRSRLTFPVWAILGYVFINYGLTTWFIVAIALATGPEGHSLTTIGFALFVLWSIFSLTNYVIAKFGSSINNTTALILGILANFTAVVTFVIGPNDMVWLLASCILIGIGMGLNNAPTTDFAFRMTPPHSHGQIASLDIIAARLGGAVFVTLIPVTGSGALWGAGFSLAASLILIYCASKNPKRPNPSQIQMVL